MLSNRHILLAITFLSSASFVFGLPMSERDLPGRSHNHALAKRAEEVANAFITSRANPPSAFGGGIHRRHERNTKLSTRSDRSDSDSSAESTRTVRGSSPELDPVRTPPRPTLNRFAINRSDNFRDTLVRPARDSHARDSGARRLQPAAPPNSPVSDDGARHFHPVTPPNSPVSDDGDSLTEEEMQKDLHTKSKEPTPTNAHLIKGSHARLRKATSLPDKMASHKGSLPQGGSPKRTLDADVILPAPKNHFNWQATHKGTTDQSSS